MVVPERFQGPPASNESISDTWSSCQVNVCAQNDAIPFHLSRGDYLHIDRDGNISAQSQPAGVQFERQVRVGLSLSRALGCCCRMSLMMSAIAYPSPV